MKKKNKNELNFLYVKINSCTLINFMEVIPSNYSKTEKINVLTLLLYYLIMHTTTNYIISTNNYFIREIPID